LALLAAVFVGVAAALVLARGKRPPEAAGAARVAARPPAPAGPVNPAVQALVNHAEAGRWHDAEVAAEKLPDNLALDDFRRLLVFTLGSRPERLDSPSWDVVVNDAWNALRRQKSCPPEFAGELIAYFRAPGTTGVLKDYAVQHLGAWISADLPAGEGEKDPATRREILSFLLEVAGMRSEPYSGTALYSLDRGTAKAGAAEDADPAVGELKAHFVSPLRDAALALASDSSASALARISAFQILLERGDSRGLVPARQVAADAKAPPMLRASAIACLGGIGAPSDFDLLAPIAKNCSDPRLLGALRPAMGKLSKARAGS
jgi:hypothetical protein